MKRGAERKGALQNKKKSRERSHSVILTQYGNEREEKEKELSSRRWRK